MTDTDIEVRYDNGQTMATPWSDVAEVLCYRDESHDGALTYLVIQLTYGEDITLVAHTDGWDEWLESLARRIGLPWQELAQQIAALAPGCEIVTVYRQQAGAPP